MKKVLLLSCFICMTAQAGTGGGTSTPPARAGLAKLIAEEIGLGDGAYPLFPDNAATFPLEIELSKNHELVRTIDRAAAVEIFDRHGDSRSYMITDSEDLNQIILKDRRASVRAFLKD